MTWQSLPEWIRQHAHEWTPEDLRAVCEALSECVDRSFLGDPENAVGLLQEAAEAMDGLFEEDDEQTVERGHLFEALYR